MLATEITDRQLSNISTIERVCSSLSCLGCAFIIVSFISCSAFHKPINRLVFFASMGNILSNVATMISRSALSNLTSIPCQLQAFLIQMFMPADAYWTLAMAVNVYLTFYWKYDAYKLRKMERWYLLCCYGIPFVPAFVFIFASPSERIYGNAVLWCWISGGRWDILRVLSFYGPVWVAVIFTTGIYLRTGKEIYMKRRQLMKFGGQSSQETRSYGDIPFDMTVTVLANQVHVISEVYTEESAANPQARNSFEMGQVGNQEVNPNYTVSVTTNANPRLLKYPETSITTNPRPQTAEREASRTRGDRERNAPRTAPSARAAWSYTKVSVLFFIAMLVTWIPSSSNRVFSVVHPNHANMTLEYASAFVLPLQGFWNAIIYISTSLPAVHIFWGQIKGWFGRPDPQESRSSSGMGGCRDSSRSRQRWRDAAAHRLPGGATGRSSLDSAPESMKELRNQTSFVRNSTTSPSNNSIEELERPA